MAKEELIEVNTSGVRQYDKITYANKAGYAALAVSMAQTATCARRIDAKA